VCTEADHLYEEVQREEAGCSVGPRAGRDSPRRTRYHFLYVTQHTSTHICLFGIGTTFSTSLNTPQLTYVCLGQVRLSLRHSTHLNSHMFVWDRYGSLYVTQHTSTHICLFGTGTALSTSLNTP